MLKWYPLLHTIEDKWNKNRCAAWRWSLKENKERKLDSHRIVWTFVRWWRSLTPPLTISFIIVLQIAQGSSTSLSLLSHRHTNTHIYIPHYTGRQQITAPTASTLNSPKASFTSKQGLSDLTLEGRQQPTLFFHLARRQEHRWINNTTQPRGAARASTTSLLLKYFSIW